MDSERILILKMITLLLIHKKMITRMEVYKRWEKASDALLCLSVWTCVNCGVSCEWMQNSFVQIWDCKITKFIYKNLQLLFTNYKAFLHKVTIIVFSKEDDTWHTVSGIENYCWRLISLLLLLLVLFLFLSDRPHRPLFVANAVWRFPREKLIFCF